MTEAKGKIVERYSIYDCQDARQVQEAVGTILQEHAHLLPADQDALILLKPNLNSDMGALTGNTTDLRVIVGVISCLQDRGYANIVIGDGPNTGLINRGINAISRLKIDRVAERFNVRAMDFNSAEALEVEVGGQMVKVPRVCSEAALFLNIPKIKTHAEAGFSSCLKNMVGCAVGLDKQKIHDNLPHNILLLNRRIMPHLHIVDGLVAMEGTGPSAGAPVVLNLLYGGQDPLLLDLMGCKIGGLDYRSVAYLRLALKENGISPQYRDVLDATPTYRELAPPDAPMLQKIIANPRLRPQLMRVRYLPGFRQFFSSVFFSNMMYLTKAGQERYSLDDGSLEGLQVDVEKCALCQERTCAQYCPLGIEPAQADASCLLCAYCYFVCPVDAVRMRGNLGYLAYHEKSYRGHILAATHPAPADGPPSSVKKAS